MAYGTVSMKSVGVDGITPKRPPNRPQPACTAESEKSVLNAQAAATYSPYDLRAGLRNAWCIKYMFISLDIFRSLVLVEPCAHVPGNGRRLQTGSPNAVKKTGRCQYAPVRCLLTETNGGPSDGSARLFARARDDLQASIEQAVPEAGAYDASLLTFTRRHARGGLWSWYVSPVPICLWDPLGRPIAGSPGYGTGGWP